MGMMKTRLLIALAAGGALLFVPARAAQPLSGGVQKMTVTQSSNAVSAANNQAGFDLLKRLLPESKDNVLISPYSISCAMWLVASGAAGETRKELEAALGLPNGATAAAQGLKGLSSQFSTPTAGSKLTIANAVFVQKGYPLQSSYVNLARTTFGGAVESVDYASGSAPNTINGWVSKNTAGKIPAIVGLLPATTRMVIANAVYFKAPWQEDFSKYLTAPAPFNPTTGKPISIPFMHQEETMVHAKNASCELVALPYKYPSTCEMVVLLPAKGKDLNGFVGELSTSFSKWRDAAKAEYGTLALPKFKTSFDTSLSAALKGMGVKSAFTPGKADFSAMTSSKEPLAISDVLHKTYLDVNEEGTEAAAATAVMIAGSAAPMERKIAFEMKVDRPFVLAIVDSKSRTILFAGVIQNPAKK